MSGTSTTTRWSPAARWFNWRNAGADSPPSFRALIFAIALVGGCGNRPADSISVEPIPVPAAPGSGQPNLARVPGGRLLLSWLEPLAEGAALRYAILGAHGWEPAKTLVSDKQMLINWADFPSMLPARDGLWAAHWLTRTGTAAYDIAVAVSEDSGATWNPAVTPHADATPTEHGFVSLYPAPAGVGVLWLDGRNLVDAAGSMTLRGAVVAADGSVSAGQVIDDRVCDCCQTDVAMGPQGPMAVYRDRTLQEIRDINLTRFMDGAWQPGQRVATDGWKISGCPVNGPAIDANGSHASVAWFTGANDKPRVRVALSADGAASFSAPVDVGALRPMGRVDVVTRDDGGAAVAWLRKRTASEAELCVREIAANGAMGPVHVVARTSTQRPSGFPRLQRHGDGLVIAWTEIQGAHTAVRAARLTIARD